MFADSLAIGVSLAELFPNCRFHYARDIRVTSCCADAQQCQPGDLYVALLASNGDGHFDAELAVQRGAAAVLTERLLPVEVPQCIVKNTNFALARLCQRLAGSPAKQLSIVGVAGHRGKTAVQLMISRVLEAGGHLPAAFGQFGYAGEWERNGSKTAPVLPSQYASWLAQVATQGCSHAVTELPREPVVRHAFSSAPMRVLILGGLSTSTHRRAPSPKTRTYVRRLLNQLRSGSMVIANIDCPIVRDMVSDFAHPVLTVSTEHEADVTARRLEQFPSEQTFLLEAGEQTSVVRSRIIGDTHLQSCLLAIAAGLGSGVDLATSVRAIEGIQSIPGHLERVECGQPFAVFSDAASSANQLRDTLLTLREVTERRLICVFGQGESERPELRALRGSVAERYADLGIITSDVVGETEPLRVAHDVLDGYRQPGKAHVMPNRTRAIGWALEQAQSGDTVLLAGPHNRKAVRSDEDFPADTDVAKFHLFSSELSSSTTPSGDWLQLFGPREDPSWN